jgi:hypothetical protein
MSSSIWTQCAGASSVAPLAATAWRVVEAQHQISTRKLVDSAEEQIVLESLIETAKPPMRGPRLHTLLATPFRYPPLRHGSRFGARHEPGLWYGSEDQRTLFAEAAYYRFLFLEGTRADLGLLTTWHTAFTVQVRTGRGLDLTAPPFTSFRSVISSPVAYADSQQLGREMRGAGVEAARYYSARDTGNGVNVVVLAGAAFGQARPREFQTWHAVATRARVEFLRRDWTDTRAYIYPRDQFVVGGALPAPAL